MRIHEFLELYSFHCICLRIYFAGILRQIIEEFPVFFKIGNLPNICVKCHQRRGPRGEAVRRQRGCPPGPGVQRWMSWVVYQRLSRASRQLGWRSWWWEWRTEQGYIELETQYKSDTSEDIQDTQAAGEKGKGKGKADKRSKKPAVLFSAEEEQKLVDFLRNNEILYKCLMDYKDRSKREAMWDKFCEENNLVKGAC